MIARSVAIVVGLFAVITTSVAQLPLTTRDFKLQIATGETITLSAPAATAGYTLTLPTTRGTSGYLLSADGVGGMLWTSPNGTFWGLAGNSAFDSTTTYFGTVDEAVGRPLVLKTDGTERARFAGGSGYAGFATAAPNVQLDVDGGFATRPAEVSATSATTAITVGNRSMIVITSDDIFSSRRITLSDGLQSGQRLVLIVLGSGGNSTYGVRLLTSDSNIRLSGDAGLEDGDTIELVWYSNNWYELKRSANDD